MNIFVKVVVCLALVTSFGCASHVKTWDDTGTEMKGIPANRPTLVKIVKVTTYAVKPGGEAKYCAEPTTAEEYDILALGEPYYIQFDPASLAKGTFKVTFSDKGLLSGIELNSDAGVAENIGKINELLGTILPYAATKKAAEEAAKGPPSANDLRAQNCFTKETSIKEIVKLKIK